LKKGIMCRNRCTYAHGSSAYSSQHVWLRRLKLTYIPYHSSNLLARRHLRTAVIFKMSCNPQPSMDIHAGECIVA
jgi:hypothetical protein